jgi:hypothetical protein
VAESIATPVKQKSIQTRRIPLGFAGFRDFNGAFLDATGLDATGLDATGLGATGLGATERLFVFTGFLTTHSNLIYKFF